jgi:NADH-quinone oxidoreductase subunit K
MDFFALYSTALVLFVIGLFGVFANRKNIITMLMSIELMLLAVNLALLLAGAFLDDMAGYVFALLVLTVAAAESSIGLALLVVYFRVRGGVAIDFITLLRGDPRAPHTHA